MDIELKQMTYTKDDGDVSKREVLVVSEPRDNYLMYDVTKLEDEHLDVFIEALVASETYRENCMADFELVTGIKVSSLWRSFKPGGINWGE